MDEHDGFSFAVVLTVELDRSGVFSTDIDIRHRVTPYLRTSSLGMNSEKALGARLRGTPCFAAIVVPSEK